MANKFNFEQLKKHTEYSLQYELKDLVTNDVVVFDIKPKMDDRTAFLELISNKKTKPHQIVNWFSELVFRTEEATEEMAADSTATEEAAEEGGEEEATEEAAEEQ